MMRVARIIFISRVNRIALTATPAPELLSDSTKRAFLSFPYVCPEPVLVKSSFLYKNGAKARFSHLSDSNIEAMRLNGIALIKSGKNHPLMYIPAAAREN